MDERGDAMIRLIRLLAGAELTRNQPRAALLLGAIIAASSLVVWTVGGYQALFTEAFQNDSPALGRYDLIIDAEENRPGAKGGPGQGDLRGGSFPGPLSRPKSSPHNSPDRKEGSQRSLESSDKNGGLARPLLHGGPRVAGGAGGFGVSKRPKYDPFESARVLDGSLDLARLSDEVPAHIRAKLERADSDHNGILTFAEERTLYPNADNEPMEKNREHGEKEAALSDALIEALRADESVRSLDRQRQVRAFLFSPTARPTAFAADNSADNITDHIAGHRKESAENSQAEGGETAPAGIDPELHRRGLAAYRAVMGTPMALGSTLIGTDAGAPPFELEAGRWFRPEENGPEENVSEAAVGKSFAERFRVKPGDRLWLLTDRDEFQLEVVGLLDTENDLGVYVPLRFADQIAPQSAGTVDTLGVVLTGADKIEPFQKKWREKLASISPSLSVTSNAEEQKRRLKRFAENNTFRLQAATGTLLAIFTSAMIIFTALSIGIEQRRRKIALLRSIGLSKRQIAGAVFAESLFLAIPGWLGGLLAGWLILIFATGKPFGLNASVVGFSLLCAVVGSFGAAFFPMRTACRVEPLEAFAVARETSPAAGDVSARRRLRLGLFALGSAFIGLDLALIYFMPIDTARRGALHSGVGTLALALGVLFLMPTLVRLAERCLLPILASLLRFDRTICATELSSHLRRTVAVAAMLAIGGGLFVLTQVWGYSMLRPFLPNRQMPDAFVAFMPVGLNAESVQKLKGLACVRSDRFEPVAVEQAAFAPGSVVEGSMGGQFANVIFFGMDPDRAFAGKKPLVTLDFIEGEPAAAFEAMKTGRGVVINDAVTVDYGLKLGDTLRVCDPKNPARILEYPIVGVTKFNGWQWLSKTGAVRRHFGRSGGIVFASDKWVRDDFHLDPPSYFWFDTVEGTDWLRLESELDALAERNFKAASSEQEKNENGSSVRSGNTAYAKLSTRDSLYRSIAGRADNVIWGMSVMPLMTLVLTSIALVAVTVNSVRARRRSFGILRAVGVERSKLVRMVLAESILLGLTAACASLLFGIPAAAGALKLGDGMFGTSAPAMILPWRGLLTGLGTLVALTVAASLASAIRLGRAEPLDLLGE